MNTEIDGTGGNICESVSVVDFVVTASEMSIDSYISEQLLDYERVAVERYTTDVKPNSRNEWGDWSSRSW